MRRVIPEKRERERKRKLKMGIPCSRKGKEKKRQMMKREGERSGVRRGGMLPPGGSDEENMFLTWGRILSSARSFARSRVRKVGRDFPFLHCKGQSRKEWNDQE